VVVPLSATRVVTSGESGVTHGKPIWFRSRKRRNAPQESLDLTQLQNESGNAEERI
jgi:hypothetical protein